MEERVVPHLGGSLHIPESSAFMDDVLPNGKDGPVPTSSLCRDRAFPASM